MCLTGCGKPSPPSAGPEAGAACDKTSAGCVLHCPKVEIEINNTPATTDDLVPVKCLVPAGAVRVPCRIRAVGGPAPSNTVVLTNPDHRLRFPGDADTMLSIDLPTDGSWTSFDISGASGSAALNDAIIEVHCEIATGALLASKPVTVFWFDQAQMTLTQGGNYQLVAGVYKVPGGVGVSFSAQARIRPAGVDCTAPQITNLRIGIMQESSNFSVLKTWDTPTIAWNAGIAHHTAVDVPTLFRDTTTYAPAVAQPVNDGVDGAAPLYSRSGSALKPPIGCAGGAAATSNDTPGSQGVAASISQAFVSGGVAVGVVTWGRLVNITRTENFRTYCVLFDTVSSGFCSLREAIWTVNLDSAGAAADQHANVHADAAAAATPATGVTANHAATSKVSSPVAAAPTQHFVSP
jgi:hypothetical protein